MAFVNAVEIVHFLCAFSPSITTSLVGSAGKVGTVATATFGVDAATVALTKEDCATGGAGAGACVGGAGAGAHTGGAA